jgi:putative transposase
VGRPTRRRFRSLTRPDKAAAPVPDLVKRDFTAPAINVKWCGDLTEVPTDEGKLYLAHVEDLASRRIPGFALSEHHDAPLAVAALQMAAAVRGGDVSGVIFHSDHGSEYSAELFETACRRLGVRQSMGRVGSCFDNAASESFHSTLEFELLRKHGFASRAEARAAVAGYIDRYNRTRRHSSCEMTSPSTTRRSSLPGRPEPSPTGRRRENRPPGSSLTGSQQARLAPDTGPMAGSISNQQPSTIRGEAQGE